MSSKGGGFLDPNDLNMVLKLVKKNWYIVLIMLGLAYGSAYIYSYRLTDVYAAKVQILVKSDDVYDYQRGIYSVLGYRGGYERISNQMRVITSKNLIAQTVSKLNLDVSYFIVGRLATREVYEFVPFKVVPQNLKNSHYKKDINLKIVDSEHFEMWYEHNGSEYRDTYKFGEQLLDNGLYIKVKLKRKLNKQDIRQLSETHYMFRVNKVQSLISKYKSGTSVKNLEWTEIMEVTTEDVIGKRAIEFLDTLSAEYIKYSMQSEIDINENTLKFIDIQLDEIDSILRGIEDELENYKEQKDILNLSREEERYFEQYIEYETLKAKIQLDIKALDDLRDYILYNEDDRLLPPAAFVEGGYIAQAIKQLYTMQIKRNAALYTSKNEAPGLIQFDQEMELLKKDLLTYITNTKSSHLNKIAHINTEIEDHKKYLRVIPKTKRDIVEINRQKNVNEKIYLFLLEKRANTVIARAAIIPQTKVIESPHSIGRVKPDREGILLSFLMVGLALGVFIALVRFLIFEKIETVDELKAMTSLTVLGEVVDFKENDGEYLMVNTDPKAPITEAFRVLRTNLDYLVSNQKSKVALITSNNPGEGKTFCSVNIAAILASAGKKVLLVEMDMHKPKVDKALGLKSDIGSSTVLIGKANLKEAIQETSVDNLHAIASGPIPPNPSELILSQYMDQFLKEAQEHYDYIVLDTPPMQLITDALVLMKHTDINLFVLNTKIAKKKHVRSIEEVVEKGQTNNVGLILNGVKKKKSGYYYKYYGYGYGYGYGQKNNKGNSTL